MEYCHYLLSGLLILGFLHQGLAKPTNRSPTDEMQGDDDYNYTDDESYTISDAITTTNANSTIPPYLKETSMKKSAIEGDTLELECHVVNRAATNVLFWYFGDKLISNQNVIVDNRYKLKKTAYTLIINDIKMQDAGEYFCKVIPQKLQLQVSVNVLPKGSHLPKESIQPNTTKINKASIEKTKDGSSSSLRIHSSYYTILVSFVLGMLTYLRI